MRTDTMDTQLLTKTRAKHSSHGKVEASDYGRLALMVGLSFIAMYILMYAMVDSFSSVYNNINQVYMAGLMAAPMAIIEVLVMRSMYTDKRTNAAIIVAGLGALLFFWFGIRNQIAVGDVQFARSMIPHHSAAILMCNEAKLSDPELKGLCSQIVDSQRREVDQLKEILTRVK